LTCVLFTAFQNEWKGKEDQYRSSGLPAKLIATATAAHAYLITYSQADLTRFPDREDFARLVVQSLFNDT